MTHALKTRRMQVPSNAEVKRELEKKPTVRKTNEASQSHRLKIEGLLGAFKSENVRWLIDREKEIKQNSGMSDQAFRQLLDAILKQEAERSIIISELKKNNEGTIGEIASSTSIPQKQILRHMIALMKKGSVAIAGEKEDQYLFMTVEPPE